MRKLKDIIDTWNMVEKYQINGYVQKDGYIEIPDAEFDRLLEAVKNKQYILNLRAK